MISQDSDYSPLNRLIAWNPRVGWMTCLSAPWCAPMMLFRSFEVLCRGTQSPAWVARWPQETAIEAMEQAVVWADDDYIAAVFEHNFPRSDGGERKDKSEGERPKESAHHISQSFGVRCKHGAYANVVSHHS